MPGYNDPAYPIEGRVPRTGSAAPCPSPTASTPCPACPFPTAATCRTRPGTTGTSASRSSGSCPNVLRAYSFDDKKLAGFTAMYNELMLGAVRPHQARARDDRGRRVVREPLLLLPGGPRSGGARALGRSRAGRDAGDELPRRRARQRQRAILDFAGSYAERPHEMARPTARPCARSASPTATSGMRPPSRPSSPCPTAWRRPSSSAPRNPEYRRQAR